VTILDNYSRAVLASGLSRTPDLGTFRMVLFMAIQQHGAPEGLVTDGGSIVRAKQLLTVLARRGVQKHEIARRQAWQNSVEALVGGQRRMADWGVAPAGTWSERLAVHDLWVTEHNDQDHSAHQERPEDRRRLAAVLPRVCGGGSTPTTGTASSPARGLGGCWIGRATRGSSGGGSLPSAAWAASRWRCG